MKQTKKKGTTSMETKIFGWHFVGDRLRDGTAIPADGDWLPKLNSPIIPCAYGYHGSAHPFDALKYAPGSTLCYCEYRGDVVEQGNPVDKFAAVERRIIRRMDATGMLRYFTRMQALSVAHLWDAPDLVLDFLMTGDESISAAANAAANTAAATYAAAYTAANTDANAAAYTAANAATYAAAAAYIAANTATYTAANTATYAATYAAAYAAADASADAYAAAYAAARREFAALVCESFQLANPERNKTT
jgi:hypothetical protein